MNALFAVICPVPPFAIAIEVPFHTPVVMVPNVVIEVEPADGEAPIELYEIVFTAVPLNVLPETSPDPLLLKVKAFIVLTEILISPVPSNEVPFIVTGVVNLVAVAALPLIDPMMVLLNVFEPVTVCIPASVMSPFELNIDQSEADNKPLLEIEAVGIFNVIVGVVVPFVTLLLKSVPVVPNVKAAIEVTVPIVSVGLPVKSIYAPLNKVGLLIKSA